MNHHPHLQKRDIILDFMHKLKREAERIAQVLPILVGTLLLLTAAISPAADVQSPPPWASGRIVSLEGTNETVRTSGRDLSLDALDLLDEPPSPPPSTNQLPSFYRMAGLEGRSRISTTDQPVDEKEEMRLVYQYMTEAEGLLRDGEKERAVDELLTFLVKAQFDKPKFVVFNRLGTLFFRDQEYARAATYMRKALEIDPNDISLRCNFSAALLTTGEPDEAIEYLKDINTKLVNSRPLLFSIYFNLACGYSLTSELDLAIENLVLAANTDPAATVTSLGDTQLDNLRADERFKNLQKALEQYVLGKES